MWAGRLICGLFIMIFWTSLTILYPATLVSAESATGSNSGYTLNDFYVQETGIPMDPASSIELCDNFRVISADKTDNVNTFEVKCDYKRENPDQFIWCYVLLNINRDFNDNDLYLNYSAIKIKGISLLYRLIDNKYDEQDQNYSVMYSSKNLSEKLYYGERGFYKNNNYCIITYKIYDDSDQKAREKIDLIEARINKIIGKEEIIKGSLKITHYNPLSVEVINNPAQYTGGDLIFTLKDANGKAITGQKIYVFLEELYPYSGVVTGTNELLYFSPGNIYGYTGLGWIKPVGNCPLPRTWSQDGNYFTLTTDSNGIAKYNYLENGNFLFHHLVEYLMRDGVAKMKVWGVVFQQDPQEMGARGRTSDSVTVLYSDSVQIEFDGVAAIEDIGTTSPGSELKVRVMKNSDAGVPSGSKAVYKNNLPYSLMPNDAVLLDKDDKVVLRWISGARFLAGVKPGALAEGEFAKVWIEPKDMGWYQWIKQKQNAGMALLTLGVSVGGWMVLGTASPASGLLPGFAIGFAVGDYLSSPLIVVPHSTLLIDYNGNNTTVYTVEGNAMLINQKDQTINVTAGHKINVTDQGDYGQLVTFKTPELSSDQRQALQDIGRENSMQTPTPSAEGNGNTPVPTANDGPTWVVTGKSRGGGEPSGSGNGSWCPFGIGVIVPLVAVLVVTQTRKRRL